MAAPAAPLASSSAPIASLTRDPAGALRLGGASLVALVSEAATPTYAYDLDAIEGEARALTAAFDDAPRLVAYALKANTAGAVVRTLAEAGCGADVVSGAELRIALACGVSPERVVYSGVAKTDAEIDHAIASRIGSIHLESVEEIARVEARAAAAGVVARVSIRINPRLDQTDATHAHIATGHDAAKFGVPRDDVSRAVQIVESSPHLRLIGLGSHAGSQFRALLPYLDSARVVFRLARALRDGGQARALTFVDCGGGFGIDYGSDAVGSSSHATAAPRPADFVRAARAEQKAHGLDDLALYVEPGRSLVAPHGVLVARVIQTKVASIGRWLMIDAGMNDLLRPALYQSRHRVVPLERDADPSATVAWRVVGPVCESSDDFGTHALPAEAPSHVAILDAGAYGYTMASVYNGRQLPVEAFIRGGRVVARTERNSTDRWVDERVAAGR